MARCMVGFVELEESVIYHRRLLGSYDLGGAPSGDGRDIIYPKSQRVQKLKVEPRDASG